jgi:hypothetical protein
MGDVVSWVSAAFPYRIKLAGVECCKRMTSFQPFRFWIIDAINFNVNRLPALFVISSSMNVECAVSGSAAHDARCTGEAPNTRKKDAIREWSSTFVRLVTVIAIGTWCDG